MVPDNEGLSAAGGFAGSLFDCAGLVFAELVSGARLLWHPAKLMSKARPSNVHDGFLISCIEFSRMDIISQGRAGLYLYAGSFA